MAIAIEPVDNRHIIALQRSLNDPEVSEPLSFPTPFPTDGATNYVAERMQAWTEKTAYTFAIMNNAHCIGACSLRSAPMPDNSWELGFWIGKAYWRRGFAFAAIEQLFVFSRTKEIAAVTALCQSDNLAAIRLLEKLRFSRPIAIERLNNSPVAYPLYWFWRKM